MQDELFSRVPNSVVDLVGALLKIDVRKSRGKETTDMCKAMEELFEEARTEGEARGRAEGEARGRAKRQADIRNAVQFLRRSRMSDKRILSSLAQIFSLEPDEARSFL